MQIREEKWDIATYIAKMQWIITDDYEQ
jgi:hypothetical protein